MLQLTASIFRGMVWLCQFRGGHARTCCLGCSWKGLLKWLWFCHGPFLNGPILSVSTSPYNRGPKPPKVPKYQKTPRLHELFQKVRANFCLLPCDASQEPNGNCSEKLFQMKFFIWVVDLFGWIFLLWYNPVWNMAGSRESSRSTSEPPIRMNCLPLALVLKGKARKVCASWGVQMWFHVNQLCEVSVLLSLQRPRKN